MKLTFHSWSSDDLSEVIAYYNLRKDGLGSTFLDEFTACVDNIRQYPLSCPVYDGDFRRTLVNRFPYAVIYRVRDHEIQIMAISHVRRAPETTRERLE